MSISYEEALRMLLERITPIEETETVELLGLNGRVLAEELKATFDQPPFPRSPLDGYAVRSEDIKTASKDTPATLKVLTEVDAGHTTDIEVTAGTAIRIMTGAPIPAGADCVIMQEWTDYGEDTVAVYRAVGAGQNICEQGEDFHRGDILIEKEMAITPYSIGVIASVGAAQATVYRKPKVLLLSTGDEIVMPGEDLRPGTIYDSNQYLLQARMMEWGAEVVYSGQSGDDYNAASDIIDKYAGEADLIVTTGGVSVGKKDIMHDVYTQLAIEKVFWGVDIKPGMPTLTGAYKNTPVISLSGNPFGVVVTAELFVKAAIAKLSHNNNLGQTWLDGVVTNYFDRKTKTRRFIRARFDNGKVTVTDFRSANGTLSTVCRSNCLVDIPGGTDRLSKGDRVRVLMM